MSELLTVQRFWIPASFRYTRLSEESVEVVLASDYDVLRDDVEAVVTRLEHAENERLKGEIDTLDSLLKDRTAKLEAMTKERDEALTIQQSEECAYESTISDLIFERDNLKQHLAAALERIKTLEVKS